jgi:hypothetical protein
MIAKVIEKTHVSGLHLQTNGNHGISDRERRPSMMYTDKIVYLATFSDITLSNFGRK